MRAKKTYKIRVALADVYQDGGPGVDKACVLTFRKLAEDCWECHWRFAGRKMERQACTLDRLLDSLSHDFETDEWRGQIKGGLK